MFCEVISIIINIRSYILCSTHLIYLFLFTCIILSLSLFIFASYQIRLIITMYIKNNVIIVCFFILENLIGNCYFNAFSPLTVDNTLRFSSKNMTRISLTPLQVVLLDIRIHFGPLAAYIVGFYKKTMANSVATYLCFLNLCFFVLLLSIVFTIVTSELIWHLWIKQIK